MRYGALPNTERTFRVLALTSNPAADAQFQSYIRTIRANPDAAPGLPVLPAGAQVASQTSVRRAAGGNQPPSRPQPTPAYTPTPTYTPAPTPTPTPTSPPTTQLVTLYVNAAPHGYTGANVRARPTTASELVGELSNGATVQSVSPPVTGEDGQQWYQVQFDGQPRYVLASLLSTQPPQSPTPSTDAGTITLYVDTADQGYTGANVRARPTTESQFLGLIPNGEPVQAEPEAQIGEDGQQWYTVRYQGQTAYILASLLSEQAP